MNTNSILRIATVIFACLSLILAVYIVTDRINNPEPTAAAVAAGMGDEDHAEDEAHTEEPDETTDDHSDDETSTIAAGMGDEDHDHAEGAEGVEVSGWDSIPTISLDVIDDGHGGYVALASISNFEFAPQNVDTPAAIGEGHVHVSVNGEEVAHVYDNSYWIGDLDAGEYVVSVSLTSNDHQLLTLNGEALNAEYALTVDE